MNATPELRIRRLDLLLTGMTSNFPKCMCPEYESKLYPMMSLQI